MKFKQQLALKPGKYHIGNGQFRELTSDDIRAYVDNTKKLIAAGNAVSIQFAHPEPKSVESLPRDKKAAKVKNGVGWLDDIAIGSDGEMLYTLDVTDSDAVKKLKEGSIKFTSPHLANGEWTDGKGNKFEKFVAHVALTHTPRNTEQTAPEPEEALQFSLADYVDGANQFGDDEPEEDTSSDDEPTGSAESSNETAENPDMPDAGTDVQAAQQMEAILAHLKLAGVALPSDTDKENFYDRLLTALMTWKAAKDQVEAEAAKEEKDQEQVVEENPPMQFSLADVESGAVKNKPLGLWIKHQHQAVVDKLGAMVSAGRIPPVLRDRLVEVTRDMQFSVDGDPLASFTLPQLVAILDDTATAEQWKNSLDGVVTEEHPEGDVFFAIGEGLDTPEKASAFVDELAKRHPRKLAVAGK